MTACIRRPEDTVEAIFMDSTAEHLLVSVMNARERQYELVYMHIATRKPILLKRLKGTDVTAVGWNPHGKRGDKSTRVILLGTRLGEVFETEVDVGSKSERYAKQVFAIQSSRPEPVAGLRVDGMKGDGKFFVMVSTKRRAFQFVG